MPKLHQHNSPQILFRWVHGFSQFPLAAANPEKLRSVAYKSGYSHSRSLSIVCFMHLLPVCLNNERSTSCQTAVGHGVTESKPDFYRTFKFYHPADSNDNKHYRDYTPLLPCLYFIFTLFFSSLFFCPLSFFHSNQLFPLRWFHSVSLWFNKRGRIKRFSHNGKSFRGPGK